MEQQMKKIILLGLVLVAVGALFGCDSGNGGSSDSFFQMPNDESPKSGDGSPTKPNGGTETLGPFQPLRQYTVTFNTNGGTPVEAQQVEEGKPVEKPHDPVKKGTAGFAGWCTDEGLQAVYDFSAPVTKDFTLYAKYTSAAVGHIAYSDGTVSLDLVTAKTPVGIVVEVDASGSATKIVALREDESTGWQSTGIAAVVTEASSSTNGPANLAVIQKQAEWENNYPAFKYCVDYGQLCKDDGNWYLPAKEELNLLWTGLSAIQSGLAKVHDAIKINENTQNTSMFYWSSTEKDKTNAYFQRFNDGSQLDILPKTETLLVRPFRAFP